MQKKTSNTVGMVALGASIAGLAATAYFFLGPKGKKHLRETKAWAIKMKGDVVARLEKAREVTEPVYHAIIDSVAKEYVKGMKDGRGEVTALAKDLKKHWKTIKKSIHSAPKRGAKTS